MAKKGLAALASKQINSTTKQSEPMPDIQQIIDNLGKDEDKGMGDHADLDEAASVLGIDKEEQQRISDIVDRTLKGTPKRKQGRPKSDKTIEGVNVTFNLPDSLLQALKMRAVIDRTTQKEIVIAALNAYLGQ